MAMKKKALLVAACAAALALALGACGTGSGGGSPQGGSSSSAATSAAVAGADTSAAAAPTAGATSTAAAPATLSETAQAIAALDGVVSVEPIDVSNSKAFTDKFVVTIEQPLDHSNPSAGTFPQRVEIGLVDGARANIMETEGYLLLDQLFPTDDAHELCNDVQGNYIHVEHRFFGGSVPDGLSRDAVEGWQYMTSANAAADYHNIYETLSQVLDGPWAATGTSRGGEICTVYAYYYPDDMKVYIPYVAPFSSGREDARMYDFVYTQIGNEKYGEEKAQEYRDLVAAFQAEMMKNKDALAPALWQLCAGQGATYRENVTEGMLFDMVVLEAGTQEWQMNQEVSSNPQIDISFEGMRNLLAMPDTNDEEHQAKLQQELVFLFTLGSPTDWSVNGLAWPYYVGAAKEYGQYHYGFAYLREVCEKAGLGDVLTIKDADIDNIVFNMVLTPEQNEAFAYDGTFYEGVTQWVDTTGAKVVYIYGNSDPWYSMRMHDTDNPNVKIYTNNQKPHTVRITDFDEATMKEIVGFVNDALFAK